MTSSDRNLEIAGGDTPDTGRPLSERETRVAKARELIARYRPSVEAVRAGNLHFFDFVGVDGTETNKGLVKSRLRIQAELDEAAAWFSSDNAEAVSTIGGEVSTNGYFSGKIDPDKLSGGPDGL